MAELTLYADDPEQDGLPGSEPDANRANRALQARVAELEAEHKRKMHHAKTALELFETRVAELEAENKTLRAHGAAAQQECDEAETRIARAVAELECPGSGDPMAIERALALLKKADDSAKADEFVNDAISLLRAAQRAGT